MKVEETSSILAGHPVLLSFINSLLTWLDTGRRRSCKSDHAGAKPAVSSCFIFRRWSQMVRRLPAKQFLVGSIPTGVSHANSVFNHIIFYYVEVRVRLKTEPMQIGG